MYPIVYYRRLMPMIIASVLLMLYGLYPTSAFAQNPIVTLVTSDFILAGKFATLRDTATRQGIDLRVANIDQHDAQTLETHLQNARLVILDAPREQDARRMLERIQPLLEQARLPWILVTAQGPEYGGRLTQTRAQTLYDYYRHGGEANFAAMFHYISVHITRTARGRVAAPVLFPDTGIYHPQLPGLVTSDVRAYHAFADQRGMSEGPVIGMVIHQSFIANTTTDHIDTLIAHLEHAGARPLVFYHPLLAGAGALDFLDAEALPALDVLINFQVMYQGNRREDYARLDVPVLQAMTYRGKDAEDWAQSQVGLPMGSVPFYLAIPEFAGLTDPLIIAAVHDGQIQLIEPQAQALIAKALHIATLRHKDNAEKRIALMFYNYPPGEKNLTASFLNVPRSLASLTQTLAAAGYQVELATESYLIDQAQALLAAFYRPEALQALADDPSLAGHLPLTTYLDWYDTLPDVVRERIEARWGTPEQDPMLREDAFLIPRLKLDQLLLMVQPPRGRMDEPVERSIYHDTHVPLTHFYMAAYLYVRQAFNADVLIHFGTHGTQEWTPGKERGLSIYDDPYRVLGDLFVIYPYIVDNIGEATQAKRRGRATIISHQTPPFAPAGLHQTLMPLHDLLHEYELLDDGAVKVQTEAAIIKEAIALNMMEDINWTSAAAQEDFVAFERELHDYLHDLAQTAQPLGLHSFGLAPEPEHRLTTVMQILGEDFYARLGLDEPEELFVDDYTQLTETKPYQFLTQHLLDHQPVDSKWEALLATAREHFAHLGALQEHPGLLAALDARYIETHYGGDPIRNPESLPTGRNLYGFDPSKIPTEQAWVTGQANLTELWENYQLQTGTTLQKIAFSLWSVEAMRHLGVLEAQVFYALGVRPVWDRFGRVTDIEVIPLDELNRPRLDVVVSATGLYRDHFPHVIHLIARAVEKIAVLEEEDNAIRKNTLALKQQLTTQGIDADQAWEYALTRVFSNQHGMYGTGLDEATLASDSWEDESRLAELYLNRMQYGFGPNPDHWGHKLEAVNLYAAQLEGVDAAVLSRSSNLYGLLSTDDPFQYLGGLSLAVRHLSGQSPELFISNLRHAQHARIEPASRFLAAELRTRYLHPQWIRAMQAEGYAGTLNILDTINNFWGFQVVAPEIVRDDQWQGFVDVYVNDMFDLGVREWFEQHHPTALAQITERMLEAVRKEYWQASDETLHTLLEIYQDATTRLDYTPSSQLLDTFVEQLALGFGLDFTHASPTDMAMEEAALMDVSGQVLQPVSESGVPLRQWLNSLLIFLTLLALVGGIAYQAKRRVM